MKRKTRGTRKTEKPGQKPSRGTTRSQTKQAICLALLQRAEGASIPEMQKATGWQPHSVRGFLAGTVKKKLGHKLTSTKEERGRVYRIASNRKGDA